MEPSEGQVGQGKGKMGRLPEAVEGPEIDRSKELVVPRVLHDQLSNWCSLRAPRRDELETAGLSIIGLPRPPAFENFHHGGEGRDGPSLNR
jgi:hypothetical protein